MSDSVPHTDLIGDPVYRADPEGIFTAPIPVRHREDEYDEQSLSTLWDMQARHFWYRGRHRFVLAAVREQLAPRTAEVSGLNAIDLGGGCGGWIDYLHGCKCGLFDELALGDSSPDALRYAKPLVGHYANRYRVDLTNLQWTNRWDVIFLLDVMEHVEDDRSALLQIANAMRPGGLLFTTTPALQFFWSYNDECAQHKRRYARRGLRRLADSCGLELVKARYFMFLLSPLLWLSRLRRIDVSSMTRDEVKQLIDKTHRVPAAPINRALTALFCAESPLGLRCAFPWGTSILGVFRKTIG